MSHLLNELRIEQQVLDAERMQLRLPVAVQAPAGHDKVFIPLHWHVPTLALLMGRVMRLPWPICVITRIPRARACHAIPVAPLLVHLQQPPPSVHMTLLESPLAGRVRPLRGQHRIDGKPRDDDTRPICSGGKQWCLSEGLGFKP